MEIAGISHISAVVLIAEIGDITRFAGSAKHARHTGRAPIPVYSSDKERHRRHRGGNRRLNSVFYTPAIVRKRFYPAAQRLLARHEPTKGARGARRILQRRLLDVIHRSTPRSVDSPFFCDAALIVARTTLSGDRHPGGPFRCDLFRHTTSPIGDQQLIDHHLST
ncbi:transposase [Streptosporangium sp. NPDC006007]|uniref:transposase n=1 Tax=Streptosporangium sp. NPDC006007 TaxID=3154575 RepID=UPI0033A40094